MTLKKIKKKTVGIFVVGLAVIIIVIIASGDWLGYKALDTAESKCMMAYLNLKQVMLDLPADKDDLVEGVEDVCSTKENKLKIPPGGIWIWQARFWHSDNGNWFWQDYKRQRANNLTLAHRLTNTAHLIENKTAHIMGEAIKEKIEMKEQKQKKWETILAEIKATSTISKYSDEK
jgi:hypothetical protein